MGLLWENELNQLQQLQNWDTKIVANSSYDAPSKPLLDKLEWKSIQELIADERKMMVFKSINDFGPKYMYKMFTRNSHLTECILWNTTTFEKMKVVPYTFVRRGVPVREDTYAEPLACEVTWPVPFVAAVISPVFPLGTHLLLGEQWASVQSGHRVGLEP